MARSQYIYVAEEHWGDGHRIAAVFTVKHELATWLKRNTGGPGYGQFSEYRVKRFRDGVSANGRMLDTAELLA